MLYVSDRAAEASVCRAVFQDTAAPEALQPHPASAAAQLGCRRRPRAAAGFSVSGTPVQHLRTVKHHRSRSRMSIRSFFNDKNVLATRLFVSHLCEQTR